MRSARGRLQHVVDRALVERRHRVLVVGGDEDDVAAPRQRARDVEPATSPASGCRGTRRPARAAPASSSASAPLRGLGDDLEFGPRLGQARLQLRAQQRLVVGDQRGGHRHSLDCLRAARRGIRLGRSSGSHATTSGTSRVATAPPASPLRGGTSLGAVQRGEALAHVGEADAAARRLRRRAPSRRRCRRRSPPGAQPSRARPDRDRPAVGRRLDAVLDRVLDQRDQHHRRKRCAAQRLGVTSMLIASRSPSAPSARQVGLGEGELLAQRRRPRRAAAAARRAGRRSGGPASATPRGGSVSVRYCTDDSVLNRKCGSTCACISLSSDSTPARASRCALGFRLVQRRLGARLAQLDEEEEARRTAR